MVPPQVATQPYRWTVVWVTALSVGAFLVSHRLLTDGSILRATNAGFWLLAGGAACWLCLRTARRVPRAERLAWYGFALACGFWSASQSAYAYYEWAHGIQTQFPLWLRAIIPTYDWIWVTSLLLLPRPPSSKRLTPRHLGNLALIACALGAVLLITILEPTLRLTGGASHHVTIFMHCIGLAAMFMTALYLLWSHKWQAMYWPLVLIVFGIGLHAATFVVYLLDALASRYSPGGWIDLSWLLVFGAFAAAAHERYRQAIHPNAIGSAASSDRERMLEALLPALLLLAMLAVGYAYRASLTNRLALWMIGLGVGFAVALGLREAWIQGQEQRLIKALNTAYDAAQSANRELQQSELRFRKLNAELEARVAQRTLELEDAYRELESFSYAVAHDLKAPLRAVDGFGSMLAHEYGDRLDDTGQHYLQRMRNSALRMSDLIDDLLAYARVDRREFDVRAVNLPKLIQDIVREARDEIARHEVVLKVDVADITVNADEAGLAMALRNLLQNAIKFSKQAAPPIVDIEARYYETGALIVVRDNGMGFDMAYQERIFEMFQRLHRADEIPGTGIGLAIVRKAVERMGGKVWAESTLGNGAAFFIRLNRPAV